MSYTKKLKDEQLIGEYVADWEDVLGVCVSELPFPGLEDHNIEEKDTLFDLVICKRWNSFYPTYFESHGGGYIIRCLHKKDNEILEHYIAIDPGFYFMKLMRASDLDPNKISAVVITHYHPDHIGNLVEFLLLLSKLYEVKSSRDPIKVFLNKTAYDCIRNELISSTNLRVYNLDEGEHVSILQLKDERRTNIILETLRAHHWEIGGFHNALGLKFHFKSKYNKKCPIWGFTGDTDGSDVYIPEYVENFKNCDILISHLGSWKIRDSIGDKHLYEGGLRRLLGKLSQGDSENRIILLSEFGLEMADPYTIGQSFEVIFDIYSRLSGEQREKTVEQIRNHYKVENLGKTMQNYVQKVKKSSGKEYRDPLREELASFLFLALLEAEDVYKKIKNDIIKQITDTFGWTDYLEDLLPKIKSVNEEGIQEHIAEKIEEIRKKLSEKVYEELNDLAMPKLFILGLLYKKSIELETDSLFDTSFRIFSLLQDTAFIKENRESSAKYIRYYLKIVFGSLEKIFESISYDFGDPRIKIAESLSKNDKYRSVKDFGTGELKYPFVFSVDLGNIYRLRCIPDRENEILLYYIKTECNRPLHEKEGRFIQEGTEWENIVQNLDKRSTSSMRFGRIYNAIKKKESTT